MMLKLKVSVVTVCFNSVETIEETILSVVDQTYDNVEYIIIDGGSTDGTVDIIKKYAEGGAELGKHRHEVSHWISEPDKGIYDAMNKGIAIASGDYINFMNSGDKFTDAIVLKQVVEGINVNSDVLYGDCLLVYDSYSVYHKAKYLSGHDINLPFNHQAAFVKRSIAVEYPFNLRYRIVADLDFFYRLYKAKKKFQYLQFPISSYAMNGMSQNHIMTAFKEAVEVQELKSSFRYWLNLTILRIKLMLAKKISEKTKKRIRGNIY